MNPAELSKKIAQAERDLINYFLDGSGPWSEAYRLRDVLVSLMEEAPAEPKDQMQQAKPRGERQYGYMIDDASCGAKGKGRNPPHISRKPAPPPPPPPVTFTGIELLVKDFIPVGQAYLVISSAERPDWESLDAFAVRLTRAQRVVKLEVPPAEPPAGPPEER